MVLKKKFLQLCIVGFLILALAAVILNYRGKYFIHDKFVHYPPAQQIDFNHRNMSNWGKVGAFNHDVNLAFLQKISRKKINNYLFIIDNKTKLEVALIDLYYIAVINVNYFSEERTFSFQRQTSFSLPENFNDRNFTLDQHGKKYKFGFRTETSFVYGVETVTTHFRINEHKNSSYFNLQVKHIMPINKCVTYLRNGVVSYKCYGGQTSGKYQISIQNNKKGKQQEKIIFQESHEFNSERATAAFDGFRASGWQWQWVWGAGTGISKNDKHISINFGGLRGVGQDVIHVDNQVIPIRGIQYTINENATVGNSIQFKSTDPVMNLVFEITARQHKFRDMVIFKNDMVKFQGYWKGQFINPYNSDTLQFQRFPGLVETADSIF